MNREPFANGEFSYSISEFLVSESPPAPRVPAFLHTQESSLSIVAHCGLLVIRCALSAPLRERGEPRLAPM